MALTDLERACLDRTRSPQAHEATDRAGQDALLEYAIETALEACSTIRRGRLLPLDRILTYKDDGSPVTAFECEIEHAAATRLAERIPEAVFLGEESGGRLPATGLAVALDPVDGTWALVNRTESCAFCLTAYRDGEPVLGVVANPATAEIGYAAARGTARLLQIGLFGEADQGHDLPLERAERESVLVNLHPSRAVADVTHGLMRAWDEGRVRLVRMVGGSPALGLLEAAKGGFVYVNAWSRRPSEPYDLGAGLVLVRAAGGEVIDLDGRAVAAVGHRGPFVAAVDAEAREAVLDIAGPLLAQDLR